MEILKRSSHGRGEYELAGSTNGFATSSLLGKRLVIDTQSPLGLIQTGIELKSQGGKPRLRRVTRNGIHIQRQIEALLLMPKSIREEGQLLGGQPIIIADRYVLRRIEVKAVKVAGGNAILQLGGIDCINDSGTEQLDFAQRIRDLLSLYERADDLPPAVANALNAHRDDITGNLSISAATERLVAKLLVSAETAARDSDSALIPGEDPVPQLLDILGAQPRVDIPPLEQIDPQDMEIRRRVADRWRLQKDRGPTSTLFRRTVRAAYKSACLFCGLRLPSSDAVRVPGVDAAHIVPWASYDADVIGNGLCLCKLHHWAFDQYLLALKHNDVTGYEVVLTEVARAAFTNEPQVLQILAGVTGPVAAARLPDDPDDWPNPQMLSMLYEEMGVGL